MTSTDFAAARRLDLASWIFLAGRFVSNIGEQLLLYAIPLLIFESTGSVARSGQAFFTEWLPGVLLLPFIGYLTDRFAERKVYFSSELLRGLIALGGFLALRLGWGSPFAVLTAAAAALAILHSQNYVALETTIVRRFGAESLARVQSLVEGIESISEVLGPALAGLLVAVWTKQWLLALAAGVFVASGLSILALRPGRSRPAAGERPAIVAGVKRGFRIVLGLPRILALSGISLSLNLLLGVVLATNPAVARTVLGASDSEFAWIGITGGVAGAALMFCLPPLLERIRADSLPRLSFGLLVLAGALLGFSRDLAPFVLGYACLSCAIAMFNVYVRLERARAISPETFGRAIGVIILINRMGMPLAGALVALGSSILAPQSLVLGVAACSALAIFTILRFLHQPAAVSAAISGVVHDVN